MAASWGPHISDWTLGPEGLLRSPSQTPKEVTCPEPQPAAPGQWDPPPDLLPWGLCHGGGGVCSRRSSCPLTGLLEGLHRGARSSEAPEVALCLGTLDAVLSPVLLCLHSWLWPLLQATLPAWNSLKLGESVAGSANWSLPLPSGLACMCVHTHPSV